MSHIPPARRTDTIDWPGVSTNLDAQGWAILSKLLIDEECDATAGLYDRGEGFRSHVIMARHGFGRGEYRYFSYPLSRLVQALRTSLYPRLAPIANEWHERMGMDARFPTDHAAFIERCHQAGQTRPTPLLLQYGAEDYNCLHQDLYGEHVFPLQVAILLSEPGVDFSGIAGWVSDRTGYRYDQSDPETGRPWPDMPCAFRRLAADAAERAGFPAFAPDACLINRYVPGARLTLHQDKNERDFGQPIVSVSLGLPAIFLWGGQTRAERPRRVPLTHGDVVVWGGPARKTFHGVLDLAPGEHRLTGPVRYNLTFRKAL